MATKFIGVGIANDRKPGDVPAIPEAGLVLVSVLSEGVLLPEWQGMPEPELTAPGDDTQVLYNSSDTVAAATGVKIVDDGDGLQATHFDSSGTVGTSGFLRVHLVAQLFASIRSYDGVTRQIMGIDTDESSFWDLYLGDGASSGNNALYLGAKTFGQMRIAGNFVFGWDANGIDVNGKVITNVALLNGAAPLAPVEGTVLANADANIVATDGSQIRIPTLTANRTYDINNTGAIDEETITLYRTGTEAFTATIRDAADATIATFPASTKLAGVFRKATGANFVFVGFQRIA